MDIVKRLESLERDIVARDSSKRIEFDALLAGMNEGEPKADKPKQEEQSKPVEPIDFDKMVETLSDYRKMQSQKKEKNEIPQEFIIE